MKHQHNWKCKDCDLEFETKAKLYIHRHAVHNIQYRNTSKICPHCKQHYDGFIANHKKICPALRHGHTHTEEEKLKISLARKKWLKENPDKHPWKKKEKFKSVPCEYLKSILKNDFEFIEEYTDIRWKNNYSIDIAFLDKKIAVEVNGEQHYKRDGSLKNYYQKRHDYFVNQGWLVLEIHYANCFKNDSIDKIKNAIINHELLSENEHKLLFQNMKQRKENTNIEKQLRREQAIKEGKISKNGKRIVANKKSEKEWIERKNIILDSNIDITKFGWVKKVIEKTGLTYRQLEDTIEYFPNDFKKCFKRKFKK